MLSFWKRNNGFIIFGLVLVLLIGFTSYYARQRDHLSWLEEQILRLLSPLERGSSFVVHSVQRFFSELGQLLSLRATNAELQAELAALKMQFNLLVEAERENQRLRQLLSYQVENPRLRLQMAQVLAISDNPWQQELVIDQGTLDGLSNDMAVITHEGFVGRIYEAGERTSKVVLISDARGPVAGQVQETRVRGTVEADPANPGWLRMIRLPRDAAVLAGHRVITSGTGGLALPAGLLIGEVVSTEPTPDGLQLVAAIKSAIDFNSLENVLVVTGMEGH
ncbi:MAG: rod shape-determining protein MreC [Bacillota bacterium]